MKYNYSCFNVNIVCKTSLNWRIFLRSGLCSVLHVASLLPNAVRRQEISKTPQRFFFSLLFYVRMKKKKKKFQGNNIALFYLLRLYL